MTFPITPTKLIENTSHNLVFSGNGVFITNADNDVAAMSKLSPIFLQISLVGL